jgi:uncharacterized SAM-binding protein YcdF (DUF218 family)
MQWQPQHAAKGGADHGLRGKLMDSIFFWLSKLFWLAVAPDSLLLILVLLSWGLLWRGAARGARRLLACAAAGLLLLAFFPVGEWLLYPLEQRFPANPYLPQAIDGIVVLGGAEDSVRSAAWDQVEVGDGAERFLASMALSRRYPQAKLVFSGGGGRMLHPEYKGTDVARSLYQQQGLDVSRIAFESESRNTIENALLSKALVKPAAGANWILVTSAFHMPRSLGIFCKAGWPVIPYPVDHQSWQGNLLRIELDLGRHLVDLGTGVREWIGLAAYYLTGKTSALFPAGCRMHQ